MLNEQQGAFRRVLELVEKAGCSNYLMLIGSLAEYVYREVGVLKGFDPNIRTMDVDYLVLNQRKPNPPAHLIQLRCERRLVSSYRP